MIRINLMKPGKEPELVQRLVDAGIRQMLTDVGGGCVEFSDRVAAYPPFETNPTSTPDPEVPKST